MGKGLERGRPAFVVSIGCVALIAACTARVAIDELEPSAEEVGRAGNADIGQRGSSAAPITSVELAPVDVRSPAARDELPGVFELGLPFGAAVSGDGASLWATNANGPDVVEIDLATARIVRVMSIDGPSTIADSGAREDFEASLAAELQLDESRRTLWVLDYRHERVAEIDLALGRMTRSHRIGASAAGSYFARSAGRGLRDLDAALGSRDPFEWWPASDPAELEPLPSRVSERPREMIAVR
jgi:hypothetical protein